MSWLWRNRAELIVWVAVIACVLEGSLRKWLFRASGGEAIYLCYFAKDIFLAALILLTRPRETGLELHQFRKVLTIGLFLVLTGAGISAVIGINWVGALLSFRALCFLPVVAYLAVSRLAGMRLEGVASLIGCLTLGNAILGAAQYSSPADSPINYYAVNLEMEAVAFEGHIRSAGTFSYISGYGNMASAGSWAGLTLLCLAAGRARYVVAGWATYVAALLCALLSISRATVIIVLLTFVVFVLSGKHAFTNVFKAIFGLVSLMLISYALNVSPLMENLSNTLLQRDEEAGDTYEDRVIDPITEIGLAAHVAPFGAGFGSEQVGGVFAEEGIMSFRNFEYQFPRIVLETGIAGLIGFVVTCAGAFVGLVNARSHCGSEGMRRVCILSMFTVASLFFINAAFNHVASFFAWTFVAITIAAALLRTDSRIGTRALVDSHTLCSSC